MIQGLVSYTTMNNLEKVIDTREPEEYHRRHVAGAINIPARQFRFDRTPHDLRNTPLTAKIRVYCNNGQRADDVLEILLARGFTNSVDVTDDPAIRKALGT